MKKLIVLFLLAFFLQSPKTASAADSCQLVYGGGYTCLASDKLILDKKVMEPQSDDNASGKYVDNLSVKDTKFQPTEQITFRISVRNTSDKNISSVSISDSLPSFVSFVSGPGQYDKAKNEIAFSIKELKQNETKTWDIVLAVKKASDLNFTSSFACVLNQATATVGNEKATDSSSFCIEKGFPLMSAPKLSKTPPTGPGLLSLVSLIPISLAGFYLRRKGRVV